MPLRRGIVTGGCFGPRMHFVKEAYTMNRIQTLDTRDLAQSAQNGGCGECQTSCQSACKTSCGVANQQCEKCGEEA